MNTNQWAQIASVFRDIKNGKLEHPTVSTLEALPIVKQAETEAYKHIVEIA